MDELYTDRKHSSINIMLGGIIPYQMTRKLKEVSVEWKKRYRNNRFNLIIIIKIVSHVNN